MSDCEQAQSIASQEERPLDRSPSFGDTRSLFNSRIHPKTIPVKHDETIVLMLYWENSDLDIGPEVQGLQAVFQEKYGFQVRQQSISPDKLIKPKAQVAKAILDLLDVSKHERTLLIIYYAGHDFITEGRPNEEPAYKLLGTKIRSQRESKKQDYHEIIWHEVEVALNYHDSDKLVIFDCCFAGWLRDHQRAVADFSFEFLGACETREYAYGPSLEYSYTKALTLALHELSDMEYGFHTATLHERIKHHQQELVKNSGKDPVRVRPVLFSRDPSNHNPAHIWLHRNIEQSSPGAKQYSEDQNADVRVDGESWYIRINLNDHMDPETIKQLGDEFNNIYQQFSDLHYVELIEPRELRRASDAVRKWISKVREGKAPPDLTTTINALDLHIPRDVKSDPAVGLNHSISAQLDNGVYTPETPSGGTVRVYELAQMVGSGTVDTPVESATTDLAELAGEEEAEGSQGVAKKRPGDSDSERLPTAKRKRRAV